MNSIRLHDVLPEAEKHLQENDPVMATLVTRYGRCQIGPEIPDPFQTLVHSIIGQQLSVKAARSIRQRIEQHVRSINPSSLLSASVESLQQCGLSRSKVRYLHALSELVCREEIPLSQFSDLTDEAIIDRLIRVPGIGRWTADMFLIFGLQRSDVLALGDGGLKRAVRNLYGDEAIMAELGKQWQPYRSIASWYLWQSLDNS